MVTMTAGITTTDRIAASLNPFRYRGYYFDTETGLYYLNSRYYNPNWARFISSDVFGTINATPGALTDKNLFAYCDNNPITRKDDGGDFWHIIVGAAIGAVVGGVVKAITNIATGNEWSDGIGLAMASGALS